MGALFGHIVSKKTRKKISQSLKGNIPAFKGKHHTKETRLKIKIARAKQIFSKESIKKRSISMSGRKNPNWKGGKVGYAGVHKWINKQLGKAKKCSNENCIYPRKGKDGKILLSPKRFEWANISKKYKRDLSDFRELCSSCNGLDRIGKRVSPL